MTTFIDGPANGQHLMLTRAPRFLRVAEADGKWDALDQLEDTPRPEEKLYAYQLRGEAGMCHIYARGKGARSGFYTVATYFCCRSQPTDEQMRDTAKWIEWCKVNVCQLPAA